MAKKWLTPNDLNDLEILANKNIEDDTVTIPREAFEELMSDYRGYGYNRQGELVRRDD